MQGAEAGRYWRPEAASARGAGGTGGHSLGWQWDRWPTVQVMTPLARQREGNTGGEEIFISLGVSGYEARSAHDWLPAPSSLASVLQKCYSGPEPPSCSPGHSLAGSSGA